MFAGIQEILVLVVIVLGILFLPRMLPRQNQQEDSTHPLTRSLTLLSGRMRLAITSSLIWLILAAGYYEPWKKDLFPFFYMGIGPVVAGWSLRWVITGYRKNKTRSG